MALTVLAVALLRAVRVVEEADERDVAVTPVLADQELVVEHIAQLCEYA